MAALEILSHGDDGPWDSRNRLYRIGKIGFCLDFDNSCLHSANRICQF